MFTALNIENFRGFKQSHTEGLARLNVVVGANAAGKTALLEAILLASRGHPQNVVALNVGRDLPIPSTSSFPGLPTIQTSPAAFDQMWSHLFYESNMSKPISIELVGIGTTSKRLRISSNSSSQSSLALGFPQAAAIPKRSTVIQFEASTNNEIDVTYDVRGNQAGLVEVAANPTKDVDQRNNCAFFGSNSNFLESDNVQWYSSLSVAGNEARVIKELNKEFPQIEGLEILSPSGVQAIWAKLKDNGKLPVSQISAGIRKVLTLILASLSFNNGIILIDELENGIYFERYKSLWRLLFNLAVEQNNQLFVSTHSSECLKSMLDALNNEFSNVALLRVSRAGACSSIRRFSGVAMRDALEQDSELRA